MKTEKESDHNEAETPTGHPVTTEEIFLDDDENGSSSGAKFFITLLLVILAAGGFLLLAWYAYNTTIHPTDVATLETVKADNSPTKHKPDEPGGMVVPNMDKTVYDNLSGNNTAENLPKVERLLPAPEEPVNRATVADMQQTAIEAENAKLESGNKAPAAPVAAPLPQPTHVATTHAAVTQPIVVDKESDNQKPVAADDLKTAPEDSKTKQQLSHKRVKDTGIKIQIASVKSEKDAVTTWARLRKTYPEYLGKLNNFVERKDLGSKGIFYRLQAGPVSSTSEARLLCKKLTDLGQGCLIVK